MCFIYRRNALDFQIPVRFANMNSASLIDQQHSISNMGNIKTVSVDSVGAHNAALALVTNNLMDIFGK